ncbi:MAG: rhomboid family intramembrane serine protease [bacterium]|nr:rhomboid family intramembrane serine protease [bacterium]
MAKPTSMICPNCGSLISTQEKTCPHCGASRPNFLGLGPVLNRLFGSRIDVLALIPTACIVLYVLSLLLDLGAALNTGGSLFRMLSPDPRPLEILGMTSGSAPWWTVLTATYLHGGLLHILFNVMWIRQLGSEVGQLFGPARYFIIYTVAGSIGFLLSNAFSGAPTVGASGAIFGLLAAMIVYGRNARTSMAAMMTRQIWQWAIMMFIFGFLMTGVNNLAHFGGFVGGWIAAQVLVSDAGRREGRITVISALLCLVLTILGFLLSIWHYLTLIF